MSYLNCRKLLGRKRFPVDWLRIAELSQCDLLYIPIQIPLHSHVSEYDIYSESATYRRWK